MYIYSVALGTPCAMSNRMLFWFQRFFRSSEPFSKRVASRKLVPDRFSGPKQISVYYRVEDTYRSKGYSIGHLLQPFCRFLALRPQGTTMACDKEEAAAVFSPPEAVRGMRTLDRSHFSRTISLSGLKVPSKHIPALTKMLKMSLFKMQRVKAVAELSKEDPLHNSHKLFLLDPRKFKTAEDFSDDEKKRLVECGVDAEGLSYFDLEVGYKNWGSSEILRAVLPETSEGVSGFSIIGHIAHLNLKPEVLDYRHLIGEVILDKNSSVRTVVNKVNIIDNTFRNFQMELLAGENNLVTRAKENGCIFEMDFSKVYWNPRLSTEHARVVELLTPGDVLYDVFAGVGPFAIPAAKKRVLVLANDLNPHSYSALNTNVKLNKVKADRLKAYNLDGREFILTVLKPDLATRLQARARVCGNGNQRSDSTSHTEAKAVAETVGADSVERSSEKLEESEAEDNASKTFPVESCSTEQQETPECQKKTHSATSNSQKTYITMNLPALALEFLDTFCGLLSDFPTELRSDPHALGDLPTILCYCFENKNDGDDVRSQAEKIMGLNLPADTKVRHVRNVAPSKEMMCLEFPLTAEILFGVTSKSSDCQEKAEEEQPPSKRPRMSESV